VATYIKDFRVKHGLIVEANTHLNGNLQVDGTITGLQSVTANSVTSNITSFSTTYNGTAGVGQFTWNEGDGTLDLGLKGGEVTLQVGQETVLRVYNDSGSTLTEGEVVYISGSQGNRVAVKRAQANSESSSVNTVGMVTENILDGEEGYITTSGLVNKLDTSALTAGPIYLSPTVAGEYTQVKPIAPEHLVIVGYVNRIHATVGSIYIKVDNGYELEELHNVYTTEEQNNDLLTYVSANTRWENKSSDSIIEPSFSQANTAVTLAQEAFNNSNVKFNSSGGNITGNVTISGNNNLTVTGDLFVQGNTITTNTQSFVIADPVILLASGNFFTDTKDIGFVAHYNNGANAHTGFIRDYVTKEYYIFDEYTPEMDANNEINISDASFRSANVNAGFFKGNVIGTSVVSGGVNLGTHIQSAYNQANTSTNNATSASSYANTGINNAASASLYANTGINNAASASLYANTGINNAASASLYANSGITLAQAAFNQGNSTATVANTANNKATSAGIYANTGINNAASASLYANTGITLAQASFNQGNSTATVANTAVNNAASASLYANTGITLAQASFNQGNSTATVANTGVNNAASASLYANAGITLAQNSFNQGNSTAIRANTDYTTISVTAATYGNATSIPVITLSANGRITSVTNTAITAGATITDDTSTNATRYILFDDVTSGTLSAVNTSSTKLTYNPSTGTLTTVDLNSTSDRNAKDDIQPIESPLDIVNKLNGYSFKWKDSGNKSYGVIAQELQKLLPELVKEGDNGLSVSYIPLIAILIEAVKEQQKQIDKLMNNNNNI
jgi:hypothetical protein